MPGPILAAGSGVLFGPVLGLFVTLGATVGTAIIAGLIGRRAGRNSARELLGTERADRLDRLIERRGLWAVVGQKFIPGVSDALASYAFGAFGVPLWQMAVGAFIGSVPRAFVYTALGASIGDLSLTAGLRGGRDLVRHRRHRRVRHPPRLPKMASWPLERTDRPIDCDGAHTMSRTMNRNHVLIPSPPAASTGTACR